MANKQTLQYILQNHPSRAYTVLVCRSPPTTHAILVSPFK